MDEKPAKLDRLLRDGKAKGHITYDDIDGALPVGYQGGPELAEILTEVTRNGLEIVQPY